MTVARSDAPMSPRPISRTIDPVPGAVSDLAGSSFADLLGAARNDEVPAADLLTAGLAVEVGFHSKGRTFSAAMHVADNAIRFDARAIVAPSGFGRVDSIVRERRGAPRSFAVAGMELPTQPPTARDSSHATQQASAPDLEGEGVEPKAKDREAVARPASRSLSPERLGHAMEPAHPESSETSAARAVGYRSRSAPHRAAASAVILPKEVVVTLHGVRLSQVEQDEVVNEVRDLLRQLGLSGRHVRIQPNTGSHPSWP